MANISDVDQQVNGDTPKQSNGEATISCAVCDKACAQRCSSCRKVAYCCKDHQKEDWKAHKSECFPAKIESNDLVGRHLVATRDIKIGEIILKEKPLVAGPKNCVQNGQYYPICLACFKVVCKPYFCKICKWPVCNAQCESAPDHRNNECQIFCRQKVLPSPKLLNEVRAYEKIIILRALLCKQSQPKVWKKICALESNMDSRSEGPVGVLPTLMAVKFLHHMCGMTEYTIEEIDHIVGALETNVFGNDDSSVRPSSPFYRSSTYLYYFGSMPAHDCQPSSVWSIQANSEFHLKATVPISAGESITDVYSPVTVGTLPRRKHLKDTKYFDCSCKRCQDATELGTHFSSLKCTDCQDGYLVSASPLKPNSDWVCQPSSPTSSLSCCGMVKPVTYAEDMTYQFQVQTKAVMSNHAGHDAASILKCIANLRQLVAKYYPKLLHPNHYLIFDLEIIIIQKISYFFSASSIAPALKEMKPAEKLELLDTMIGLSKKCLEIASVIIPGYSILRGRLLYFLQQGFTVKLFIILRSMENTNKLSTIATQFLPELQELENARKEAIIIFNNVLEGREEFSLRKLMMEPSDQLRFVQAKLNCKQ